MGSSAVQGAKQFKYKKIQVQTKISVTCSIQNYSFKTYLLFAYLAEFFSVSKYKNFSVHKLSPASIYLDEY